MITYESGVGLYSANEIRFKFNPSPNGNTPFAFYGQNMDNIKLKHINNNSSEVSLIRFNLSCINILWIPITMGFQIHMI